LWATEVPTPSAVAQLMASAAAARPVTHYCTLDIEGGQSGDDGNAEGLPGTSSSSIRHAHLACRSSSSSSPQGGTSSAATVSFNSTLLAPFVSSFTGINQGQDLACGTAAFVGGLTDGGSKPQCLIVFCGDSDSIVIRESRVTNLRGSMASVCISGSVHVRFENAQFTGNGGNATWIVVSSGMRAPASVVAIHDSTMANNTLSSGVVVSSSGNKTLVSLYNTSFTSNDRSEGLRVIGNPVVLVEGCRLSLNSDLVSRGVEAWPLVSVLNSSAQLYLSNCDWSDNSDHVLLSLGSSDASGVVHISALSGKSNKVPPASRDGYFSLGVKASRTSQARWIIRDSVFSGNIGGALLYPNGLVKVLVLNTTFVGGEDIRGVAAFGNASVHIIACNFRNNARPYEAGPAVLAKGRSRVRVLDSNFTGNHVGRGGGAFHVGGNASVAFWGCIFRSNSAAFGPGGGAMQVADNSSVRIFETWFVSNHAVDSSGGAITVKDSATALVSDNTIFASNVADMDGGAILVQGTAVANVTGRTRFVNNSALSGGDDIKANSNDNLVLGDANVNITSPTVVWLRTECIIGEFRPLGGNGLCQRCAPNTYSFASK
jgi:hypothetical protein